MISYDQIKRLNDRSRLFNGPMKAIYINEVAGEDEPCINYRLVNTKSKSDYRIGIHSFISKLISMEAYAVNIDAINEFVECYEIVGAELKVKASYCEPMGAVSIYVFEALVTMVFVNELTEDNAIDKTTQKVVDVCKKNRIPLGTHGEDIINTEIKRCVDEEISQHKSMVVTEFSLDKWTFEDEDFFSLE